MNELHSSTARRIAMIQAAITDKPMTAKEISVAIHLHYRCAEKYMNHLMEKANKRVYVTEWRQGGPHARAAVYKWGKGRDAKKPRPVTGLEAQRRYRARLRKDDESREFHLTKLRAQDRARAAAKRPTTWLSALGVASITPSN